MSLAKAALARAHEVLLWHLSETASYVAPGGNPATDAVACQVLLDTEMDEHVMAELGSEYRRGCALLVRAAQVPLPTYQGTIIIAAGPNAATWHIRRVRALTGGNWQLICGADAVETLGGPSGGWPEPIAGGV